MLANAPPVTSSFVAVASEFQGSSEQAIVARTGLDALLIWNAQSAISQLLHQKPAKDVALRAIEATAGSLLYKKAAVLKSARTITLRVIYPHVAQLNPQYNIETITSVERLMTLQTDRKSAEKYGKAWAAALARGEKAQGLRISITGALPPAFYP
jgi:hypothetical protein